MDDQIRELNAGGFTDVEIARRLKITQQTVSKHRRRLGIKPLRRGFAPGRRRVTWRPPARGISLPELLKRIAATERRIARKLPRR